jgi:lipopolysaccharide biosynthesis protein
MTQAPRRAFVVAHYDPAGRVAWNLRDLVAHLATLGSVTFVSTNLADDAARSLGGGVQVITRPNEGYDFYSYKRGIEALGVLSGLDDVVILNSSFVCLDPARLTRRFFSRAQPDVDLLGLTANYEYAAHLQSYWISFQGRRVLDSPVFAQWWRDMEPVSDRDLVIPRYEVGMSQAFHNAGFKLASAFSPPPERRGAIAHRNPTHVFWDVLMEEFGVLKLELLRANPFRMDLAKLHAVLQARPHWRALVDDALATP